MDILNYCDKEASELNVWRRLRDKVVSRINKDDEVFDHYRLLMNQLLLERDAYDVDVSISHNSINILFNIVGHDKLIKLHAGNSNRIFFLDEDKCIISDQTIHDFVDKVTRMREIILLPKIYYKFSTLPPDDVIKYFEENGIIVIPMDVETPYSGIPDLIKKKVVLDQSMIITLCSNLSFGESLTFFTNFHITRDEYIQNHKIMTEYVSTKECYVTTDTLNDVESKISLIAGPNEKARYTEIREKLIVIDETQKEFINFKKYEISVLSLCDKIKATILTGNAKFANRIFTYHPEMSVKVFLSAQLSEMKYP